MLQNLNDDAKHLKALIKLASKLGRVRINLIPYNSNCQNLTGSAPEVIKYWHEALMSAGFTATVRRPRARILPPPAVSCVILLNNFILMIKKFKVAVLGAGNMGTAIAQIIAQNGYEVNL